jgi:imidazolonepropionase-like amidohydrolase
MLHVRGTLLPSGEERDVFVTDDGRLTFDADAPGAGDARTVLDGGFLLPGLVDAHAHLGLASPAGREAPDDERARASARAQLREGVLALREPGGPNRASSALGPAHGAPRIIASGRWLAGPSRFLPGFAREVSPEELPEAAVEELRAGGGGWAKVIADWRVGDEWGAVSFGPEALAETTRRVHAEGGRLAVHAMFRPATEAAIEAGVDSIEHGTFVDRTLLAAMAERAIAWTPTLCAVRMVAGGRQRLGVPPEVAADLSEGVERLPPVLHAASEAGVTVLAGTDAALPHGLVREEVAVLIEAGLPADVALAAASWEARRFLGLPGLDEGAPADLVAFDRDPREDPRAVLAAPALIVLDGRVIGPAGTIDGDRRRPG